MSDSPEQSPRVIHHALLNHVAVISTYAQLLKDSDLDHDQQELLSELSESVEQAHALATKLGLELMLHAPSDSYPDPEGGSS